MSWSTSCTAADSTTAPATPGPFPGRFGGPSTRNLHDTITAALTVITIKRKANM